jgi:hypothetical protein
MDLEQLDAMRTANLALYEEAGRPDIASPKAKPILDGLIAFLAGCHEMARRPGGDPTVVETTRLALEGLRAARTPAEIAKAFDVAYDLSRLIYCEGAA